MKITCEIQINKDKGEVENTEDLISELSETIVDFFNENEQTYYTHGSVLIKSKDIIDISTFGLED